MIAELRDDPQRAAAEGERAARAAARLGWPCGPTRGDVADAVADLRACRDLRRFADGGRVRRVDRGPAPSGSGAGFGSGDHARAGLLPAVERVHAGSDPGAGPTLRPGLIRVRNMVAVVSMGHEGSCRVGDRDENDAEGCRADGSHRRRDGLPRGKPRLGRAHRVRADCGAGIQMMWRATRREGTYA